MKALRNSRPGTKHLFIFSALVFSLSLHAQNRALFYDSLTHYMCPVFSSATTIANYNRPLVMVTQPAVHLNLPVYTHRSLFKGPAPCGPFCMTANPTFNDKLNVGLGPNNSGIGGFRLITFR